MYTNATQITKIEFMVFLFYFGVLVFGFCIGSFLNCVIYRLEKKKSFTRGRSFCPKCKHTLVWYDLIPIFSFLILQGKCRYCRKEISWQYPVTEITTGFLFLLIFNFVGLNFNLIYFLIIACLLELIFIYDLKHYIIPDKLVFSAIGIALIYNIFTGSLLNSVIAVVVSAGFFFCIWAISRGRWLGFGDVKLAFLMGIFLGFPNILTALFFAFLIGSIVGLILIALKKKKMKSEVPFGPFLVLGTFVGLFWGEKIIHWYLSFLL